LKLGARGAVTSDYYSILGVTPAAEDVVIGAAYRALMRHYHPDTNPDPNAQARVREITAAYAVLRDPAKRAEYDAVRVSDQALWAEEDEPSKAPPLRAAGIASALVALVLVGALWALPRNGPPVGKAERSAPVEKLKPAFVPPPSVAIEPLQPEANRLARLNGETDPSPPVAPPVEDTVPAIEAEPAPPLPIVEKPVARMKPAAMVKPKQAAKPAPIRVAEKSTAAATDPRLAERVATLDRISAGFFSQSMVHATDAKKELLLAARDRFTADRKACHSSSCVADAYVRQIRETSAIMESRAGPAK
jgi:hypothetical protein